MVYGRIYSIRSHQTTDIYIGSTTQILCKRLADHRGSYRLYLNKKQHYITSFEIVKYEDSYIELIYEGEFDSKDSLMKKEGEYQRAMDCVNKMIQGRTKKEYYEDNKKEILEKNLQYFNTNKEKCVNIQKQYRDERKESLAEKTRKWYEENKEYALKQGQKWREKNKERKAETDKNWREKNKELILERRKTKYTCGCGSKICGRDKSQHTKTKKHLEYIKSLSLEK
jgi:hypothetical protein